MKEFIGKNWKAVAKAVVFVLIFIILFSNIQDIFELKGSCYGKYQCYNNEEDGTIDILYFGNSRVNRALNPVIIDEITGVNSFNYGIQGLRAPHVYYRLMDALKTQSPKLVVLESSVYLPSKESLEESYIQRTFLSLPFSAFKVKGALDLGQDATMVAEIILPLLRFHGRFREIDTVDFIYNMDVHPDYPYEAQISEEVMNESRGYQPYSSDKILKDDGKHYFEKDYSGITDVFTPEPETDRYFRMMVDEAKKAGAEVLILSLPSTEKTGNATQTVPIMNYLHSVYDGDSSVKFLDINTKYSELQFNYSDMHNTGHVNRTGCRKISNYVGEFISENYSFTK